MPHLGGEPGAPGNVKSLVERANLRGQRGVLRIVPVREMRPSADRPDGAAALRAQRRVDELRPLGEHRAGPRKAGVDLQVDARFLARLHGRGGDLVDHPGGGGR